MKVAHGASSSVVLQQSNYICPSVFTRFYIKSTSPLWKLAPEMFRLQIILRESVSQQEQQQKVLQEQLSTLSSEDLQTLYAGMVTPLLT